MFARYAKLNKDSLRDRALCKQECCFFCFFYLKKNLLRLLCLQMILWNLRKCERERAWCLNHWFFFFLYFIQEKHFQSNEIRVEMLCLLRENTHISYFFRKTMWGDSKQETVNCAVFLLKLKWSAHKLWLLHYIKSQTLLEKANKIHT